MPQICTPADVRRILEGAGDCQLVDVREYPEYAGGHVPGARLLPLGEVSGRLGELDKSRPVVLICKSGGRARKAAEVLEQAGCGQVRVLDGGTDAWIAAGLAVEREARPPWGLERQVRLVAGLLVLAGVFIPPWPWLSALIGFGLAFSAVTNTCGMALLLAKMPWNRPRGGACAAVCAPCEDASRRR